MRRNPLICAVLLLSAAASAAAGTIDPSDVKLCSKTAGGAIGGSLSLTPSVSKSGRYAVFATLSANLLPGVTANGKLQIVRKDLATGKLVVVSTDQNGQLADHDCSFPLVSKNGRHVAFISTAGNLAGPSNSKQQIFWKDLASGEIRRISNDILGGAANQMCVQISMSENGNFVGFVSEASNLPDSISGRAFGYRWDARSNSLERLNYGANGVDPNNDCPDGRLSGNGRYFTFATISTNMGFANAAPAGFNTYLRDCKLHRTTLVSAGAHDVAANGSSGTGAASSSGRFVVFISMATNLTDSPSPPGPGVFMLDRKHSTIERLAVPIEAPTTTFGIPQITSNGRMVLVPTSGTINPPMWDTVAWCSVVDRKTGEGKVESLSSNGIVTAADCLNSPSLSSNGKRIVFSSRSAELLDGPSSFDQVFVIKS